MWKKSGTHSNNSNNNNSTFWCVFDTPKNSFQKFVAMITKQRQLSSARVYSTQLHVTFGAVGAFFSSLSSSSSLNRVLPLLPDQHNSIKWINVDMRPKISTRTNNETSMQLMTRWCSISNYIRRGKISLKSNLYSIRTNERFVLLVCHIRRHRYLFDFISFH